MVTKTCRKCGKEFECDPDWIPECDKCRKDRGEKQEITSKDVGKMSDILGKFP